VIRVGGNGIIFRILVLYIVAWALVVLVVEQSRVVQEVVPDPVLQVHL
jgi:hypothetical protein